MAKAVKIKTFTGSIMAPYGIITNPLSNLDPATKYYTRTSGQTAHDKCPQVHFQIVDTLPETGQNLVVYLLKKPHSGSINIYEEYIWISDKFELIGNTQPDFDLYADRDWFNTQLNTYLFTN